MNQYRYTVILIEEELRENCWANLLWQIAHSNLQLQCISYFVFTCQKRTCPVMLPQSGKTHSCNNYWERYLCLVRTGISFGTMPSYCISYGFIPFWTIRKPFFLVNIIYRRKFKVFYKHKKSKVKKIKSCFRIFSVVWYI